MENEWQEENRKAYMLRQENEEEDNASRIAAECLDRFNCQDCCDGGCPKCYVPDVCKYCNGIGETIWGPCSECAPNTIHLKVIENKRQREEKEQQA